MKRYLVLSFIVILGIISFTLAFVGVVFSETLTFIGWGAVLICLAMFMGWQWSNHNWMCTKCKETFSIKLTQYLFAVNLGDSKKLYCSNCDEKTACKPVQKK